MSEREKESERKIEREGERDVVRDKQIPLSYIRFKICQFNIRQAFKLQDRIFPISYKLVVCPQAF